MTKLQYLLCFIALIPLVFFPFCYTKKIDNYTFCNLAYGYDAVITMTLIGLLTNYLANLFISLIKKIYNSF